MQWACGLVTALCVFLSAHRVVTLGSRSAMTCVWANPKSARPLGKSSLPVVRSLIGWQIYNAAKNSIGAGEIDLDSDAFQMSLFTSNSNSRLRCVGHLFPQSSGNLKFL